MSGEEYNSTVKQLIADRSKIGITTPFLSGSSNVITPAASFNNCHVRLVPRESGRIMLCIRCGKIVLTEQLKRATKVQSQYRPYGASRNLFIVSQKNDSDRKKRGQVPDDLKNDPNLQGAVFTSDEDISGLT